MKVAFLDRDGVINEDVGYLCNWKDFKYKCSVKSALKMLVNAGYRLIVVTNQSGIARGYYSEEEFHLLMIKIRQDLEKSRINLLDVFYCPHHINGTLKEYTVDCECRKPKPGLFFQAFKKYDIDVTKSVMFGDNISDLKAAEAAGISERFLLSNGEDTRYKSLIFEDLEVAVKSFLAGK